MASLVPSTTSREQIPTSHLHQQTVAAPSTTATTSSTNHPRIKLSDLYLSLTCCSYDQLLVCVCLPTGESFQSCTCVSYLSVYASQRAWNPPELHFDNYIVRNPHFRWLLCACHTLYLSQCWLPFRTRCLLLTVANQLDSKCLNPSNLRSSVMPKQLYAYVGHRSHTRYEQRSERDQVVKRTRGAIQEIWMALKRAQHNNFFSPNNFDTFTLLPSKTRHLRIMLHNICIVFFRLLRQQLSTSLSTSTMASLVPRLGGGALITKCGFYGLPSS